MALSGLLLPVLSLLACTDKGGDDTSDHPTTPLVTDADGDGYDAIEHGGADCDDEDPSVYPGAEDAWYDGVDSDCAGDDDFDADLDGWGTDDGDCDDDNPEVSPAELDWCDDGVDQDCDGTVDGPDCGVATETAEAVWHDPGLEFLGWDLATGCDMDGDGVLEVIASAPGDDGDGVFARVVTLSEGEQLDPEEGLEIIRASTRAGFGSSVQCQGDLNGDGYGDLAVSAFDDGPEYVGRSIVALGPIGGGLWLADAVEDVVVEGRRDGAYIHPVGQRMEIHDVTGDGNADIVYAQGDYYHPWWIRDGPSAYESGATIVLRGPFETGDVLSTEVDDYVYLYGQNFGEFAVADFDGDGINDVLRTVGDTSDDFDLCGAIYSGANIADAEWGTSFDAEEGDALTTLFCVSDIDYIGTWEVYAEDLDGDGHPDPFHVTVGGWSAFQGRSDWPAEVEPDSRLQQDFLDPLLGVRMPGLRAADFLHDEDGTLTWAVSLQGYPGQTGVDAGFEGRVAVFQGWEWADRDFTETWRWVGWDADDYDIDPYYMGTRPVAFSQEAGTRLWFADPAWLTETGDETNFGRVAVFDMDGWEP